MKKSLFLLITTILLTRATFPQKEANVWYFGEYAGMDFNSGSPLALNGFVHTLNASSSICDSAGNFLMFSNGEKIWNRDKQLMLNGDNLVGSFASSQGALILQKPGSDNLYYVFTVAYCDYGNWGLYYSVVDINLDNGRGAVTEKKNVLLGEAWDAFEKLTAVKHENGIDIWIIVRKFIDDAYAAFLLSPDGISETPVLSPASDRPRNRSAGGMKVSYDKKYILSAFENHGNYWYGLDENFRIEIARFDPLNGSIEDMYYLPSRSFPDTLPIRSLEFSPDSRLLYLSLGIVEENNLIYQLDMKLIEDSVQFINSVIEITDEGGSDVQLATDGKIYLSNRYWETDYVTHGVSVIHKPWKRGIECDYELDVVEFLPDNGPVLNLSNILLDYLFRFEWEGQCSAEPFVFQSNFQPEPAFIEWNFADPLSGSNNSNEINPVHTFSSGGEYEVHVHVEYPNGRVEETSRVVTVIESPHPNLGPDFSVCEGEEVTLNAGDEEGFYAWSTGQIGNNLNEITVSDSGLYWVRVNAETGCFGTDSVWVNWFPESLIDETNLQLIPTTCGGNNGKILGLEVSGEEPLSYQWFDADSNLLTNTLDVSDLGVGNYFLHILDGNGCTTISNAYTITDAGDIEIATVDWQNTHCGQNMGSITIAIATGDPLSLLYSIDNGNSWQTGDPLFENLTSGSYFIRVKDENGCESVFDNNPVVVDNMPGPVVSSAVATPENDYLQNGQIELLASASSGNLYFSIDGGNSFQAGDGLFTNLAAGTYFCKVKDDFGCDTVFTVEVTRVISQLIEAFAGDGTTCIGNAAVVPLKLNNFTDISRFHLKLTYDTTKLSCDGFMNVNTTLENNVQVSIVPFTDEVLVSWQGETPTTLEENAILLELVFGAKAQGISALDWAAQAGESAFYNENLDPVNADYHLGMLRVYTRPQITLGKERQVCEGERVVFLPYIDGGSGQLNYFWQGPGGFEQEQIMVDLVNTSSQQAGLYTFTVTDTIDCVESKTVNLEVYPHPQIAFPVEDTIYTSPGFILEAGNGYQAYLWNTGDTTDYLQIQSEGLYSVEVTSQASCKSTDSVTVLWGGEAFWVPNAFSPDGDGLNDEFKPVERYDMVKSYNLSIYNRWGQLIFQTNDISQGWDGTYQGNPAEQGSYVYKIVFTAYPDYNNQQTKTGTVVLVR